LHLRSCCHLTRLHMHSFALACICGSQLAELRALTRATLPRRWAKTRTKKKSRRTR
jgi:hypothetical protein